MTSLKFQTWITVIRKKRKVIPYVNRITKGREQIVNKTFIKIMDELGYDVELTYKRKTEEKIAR